jgi:hypothetical protein
MILETRSEVLADSLSVVRSTRKIFLYKDMFRLPSLELLG